VINGHHRLPLFVVGSHSTPWSRISLVVP
jgi:hypothetical protein